MKFKILLFGANGFIGKSIIKYWENDFEIISAKIDCDNTTLLSLIKNCDIIINAAGVSRSQNEEDFFKINLYKAQNLYEIINYFENKVVIYLSSIHINSDSIYGFSKRYNEYILKNIYSIKNQILCYRLPGVFGPSALPNYVSVVSTFCYNISRNIPSQIVDGEKILSLIFIEDLLDEFKNDILQKCINGFKLKTDFVKSNKISVKELYKILTLLNDSTESFENTSKNDFNINLFKTLKSFK